MGDLYCYTHNYFLTVEKIEIENMLLERICALIMKSFCTISSTSFHIALGCDVSSKTILNMVTKQTKKRKFNGDIVDYITESNNWFSESNTLANTPQTVNWIKECNLSRYRGGLGFKEIICCCFLVSHLYVTKDGHHFKNLTLFILFFKLPCMQHIQLISLQK